MIKNNQINYYQTVIRVGILYTCNEKLFKTKIKTRNVCEYCNTDSVDTLLHYFYYCPGVTLLWNKIQNEFSPLVLTENSVMYGKVMDAHEQYLKLNRVILVAKYCICLVKMNQNHQLIKLFDKEIQWRKQSIYLH